MDTAYLERMIARHDRLFAEARAVVLTLDCGAVIDTGDGELTVNHVSYAKGTDLDAVLDHTATAEMVVLTADGRYANFREWHEGDATDDDWVRYERWTAEGRVAHGFIDRGTRKLLQTG
jgi:hypothetical protein